MQKSILIEIIAILFMILFLYTGINKLGDYNLFKEQIANSPFLATFAKPLAKILPWLEFLVVILLIVPRWRIRGLYISVILMTLFTGYVIGILLFDEQLPCSCGGILAELSWPQHIVFNGVFIVLAIVGIFLENKVKKKMRADQILK